MELNELPTGEEHSVDPAIVAEASEQGWVPEDKWTGDPGKWTDAATFVEKGKRINLILNKNLKKKDEHIAKLEAELSEMKGTLKEVAAFQAGIEQKAYERAIADLRGQKTTALEEGNYARAEELDEAIGEMKAEAKEKKAKAEAKPEPKGEPIPHPDIEAFITRNKDWYNDKPENEDLFDYANAVSQRLIRKAGPNPNPATILAEVEKAVKEKFTDRFQTPAMFDSGGNGGGKPSGRSKGFSSLPADAKAQFNRFYKAGYYAGMEEKAAQDDYFAHYE